MRAVLGQENSNFQRNILWCRESWCFQELYCKCIRKVKACHPVFKLGLMFVLISKIFKGDSAMFGGSRDLTVYL